MLIQDRENPTGMFSKAGRLSIEMYTLLQEKDQILSNKRKTFQPKKSSLAELEQKQQQKAKKYQENMKSLQQDQTKKKHYKSMQQLTDQPFTKALSRNYFNNLDDKLKNNNQKFGMYNPKYHYIFEKSPFYQDFNYIQEIKENVIEHQRKMFGKELKIKKIIKKSPNQDTSKLQKSLSTQQIIQQLDSEEGEKSIIDFGKNVKGCLKFSRMADRMQTKKDLNFLNCQVSTRKYENIFKNLFFKKKVKVPQNVYFQKAGKGKSLFQLPTSGLQYDVKFDGVYPKGAKLIMKFDNAIPRKLPQQPMYIGIFLYESLCDTSMYRYDTLQSPVNRSQIIKKIPGPNFEKMVSRDHEQVKSMNGSIDYQDTSLSILQQKQQHQQSSRFQ